MAYSNSDLLLRVENLCIVYLSKRGIVLSVDELCFSVKKGETIGIVGESGSGKSTIALAIIGQLGKYGRVTKGKIYLKGENLLNKSYEEMRTIRGNKISIVVQDPFTSLNPSKVVGKHISETILTHKKNYSKKEAWELAQSLLEQVGIPEPTLIAKRYPHQLSGGMQQRVIIAIAISCNPELIILDEPTTALDVTVEAKILDLLEHIKEKFQSSILFITHNFGLVSRICDRTIVIYAGRKLESARSTDLFRNTQHPYTKGLLACLPDVSSEDQLDTLYSIPGNMIDLRNPPEGCIFHQRCDFVKNECVKNRPEFITVEPEHETRCSAMSEGTLEVLNKIIKRKDVGDSDLINVINLRKYFRQKKLFGNKKIIRAVDDVTFTIKRNETFGLVGESGCGKSTLGRCIAQLLPVCGGDVYYRGKAINKMSEKQLRPIRKEIQIIFQNPDSSLNPQKKIHEIVGRPLEITGLTNPYKKKQKIYELLEVTELPHSYYSRYPHELSGGEKQRVGIARAIACEPSFIICDEPVTSLDISIQASILNLLKKLQKGMGISYLLITHDLSVIRHISHRIAVMYSGMFCEVGSTEQIFKLPYHPYTCCLLASVPIIKNREKKRISEGMRLRGGPDFMYSGEGCVFSRRCPVKIGKECDEMLPPTQEPEKGHTIMCHKPIDDLRMLDPGL